MNENPLNEIIRSMQKNGPVYSIVRQKGDGFDMTLLVGDFSDEEMEKEIREHLALEGVEVGEVLKRNKHSNGAMTQLIFDAPDGVEVVAYRREPDTGETNPADSANE